MFKTLKKILFSSVLVLCTSSLMVGQVPTPKPQPTYSQYTLDALDILPTYTRASYEQAFNVQPPPFDSTKPVKTWFDSTQPCVTNSSVTYNKMFVDSSGKTSIVPFTVPSCDAAVVNLPGSYRYTDYKPAPTKAFAKCPPTLKNCTDIALNPEQLSTLGDAQAIRDMIDSSLMITELKQSPGAYSFVYTYPADEQRRLYYIGNTNVGFLIKAKGGMVSSPGKFVSSNNTYSWVKDASIDTGVNSTNVLPTPVRALYANESFAAGPFGLAVIKRNDVATVLNATPTSNVDSGFTQTDRDNLNQVLKMLKTLLGQ